ncbi:hypothetical protein Dimus_015939 [Dionaea muscipula]
MNENGLSNVMEIIKRQKWENLFKRRELVHIDAVKEFYAKMTVIHLKKKDIVKSKVRGIEMEFDHEKLAIILGESGSDDQFYDAQVEVEEPSDVNTKRLQRVPTSSPTRQKEQGTAGVDPSCPTGKLPDAEFLKFQAEFERKRANRFHDDLEKAKAENARLLALLHQA